MLKIFGYLLFLSIISFLSADTGSAVATRSKEKKRNVIMNWFYFITGIMLTSFYLL